MNLFVRDGLALRCPLIIALKLRDLLLLRLLIDGDCSRRYSLVEGAIFVHLVAIVIIPGRLEVVLNNGYAHLSSAFETVGYEDPGVILEHLLRGQAIPSCLIPLPLFQEFL